MAKTCEAKWYTVENFDPSMECNFMNTLKVSNWTVKMVLFLVLILCTDEFVCKFSWKMHIPFTFCDQIFPP